MIIKTQLCLSIICLLVHLNSHAQIRGIVSNENYDPISQVIVKLQQGDNFISYTSTNQQGEYFLTVSASGDYKLVFSSLHYEEVSIPISIEQTSKEVEQDVVMVSKEIIQLKETIALAINPISIKQDTVIYDADFFLQGNEQVVEDLLAKLPGISVSEDGKIKVGGKEVEKVMIEGDDFFEKGYKIVTKNMPVHPIDKVELLQNYSNNKHLKGIENSEKVALNLTLKEDAKNQWFGNAEVGIDVTSLNYYTLALNLMSFGKKNKYYFLTNLNNIGNDVTGSLSHIINPSSRATDFVGDGFATEQYVDKQGAVLGFTEERTKMNNAELISLNAIFNPNKKLKIKPILFFNADENNFIRQQIQRYQLPNEPDFTNIENYHLRNAFNNIFGKVHISYDIASNRTLELSSKLNAKDGEDRTNITFNHIDLKEQLDTQTQRVDQEIQYTHKLSDSKVILMQGRYIYDNNQQDYLTNQNRFIALDNGNAHEQVRQVSDNYGKLFGAGLHYLDRKESGNLIELELQNIWKHQDLNNMLFFSSQPHNSTIDYGENVLKAEGKYTYQFNQKLKIHAGLSFNNYHFDYRSNNSDEKNNISRINPRFGLAYKLNDKHRFTTNYVWSANSTKVGLLSSDYILQGYNQLRKGLDKPTVFSKSNLSFSYIYGGWTDDLMINTFLFYTIDSDYISYNNIIKQDYSITDYAIFQNKKTFTLNTNLDYYIKGISSNLKIKGGLYSSDYLNRVNNSDIRKVKTSNYNYGISLRSSFRGIFNFHIGAKNTHSQVKIDGFKNKNVNNNSFLDTYFRISDKLDFQSRIDYYYFGNLERDKNYYFVDIIGRYELLENKLSLGLQAKNLFNTTTFTVNNISDVSESVVSYRLLPRFIMATLEFRF